MLKIEDITNIKVRVTPEQSEIIQKACFELGVDWRGKTDTMVRYLNTKLLFIDNECSLSLEITKTSNEQTFDEDNYTKEVKAEDLIAKIQERPVMTNEEKMKALYASKVVSDKISYANLVRLIDGDLAHIGEAILNGKNIEWKYVHQWFICEGNSFPDRVENYRVKQETFNLGGIDIPVPAKIEDMEADECYWVVDYANNEVSDYAFVYDTVDRRWFSSNICHKTRENAEAHLAVLKKLHGID